MISTTSMIKINKTYKNLMVDLKVSNLKLKNRAIRIISEVTGLNNEQSAYFLKKSNGHVKKAIMMYVLNIDLSETEKLLNNYNGNLREIIDAFNG